ncbi:MAG: glutathione S-transferase family protein [Sphingomonas sp.]|uniref:glutathione S-transferase family protein n=1 Tax=Sphingomonas sp. TaxID=28214 RepID=UPI0025CD2274|nr:glutathione S-transferase family protein [Sphingomonas sp.]MBX9880985.1 glutathione S-transferase family protein [Sphingomonas sp.]
MLLFDAPAPAPNPRRVRIYLAEKGLKIPTRELSIRDAEHRSAEYLAVNPLGQIPALQLDDGEVITESLSICRFLEALNPDKPLFGKGPKGVAEVDMWCRRAEFRLGTPLAMVWAHTHPFTARVVQPQYKEFGESNRPKVAAAFGYFDTILGDRPFLAGRDYTMADIVLLTMVDFARFVGVGPAAELAGLGAWYERVSTRPSAAA